MEGPAGSGEAAFRERIREALRLDRERALPCLFAPPEVRHVLMALLVVHAELARVTERVREPMAGAIRYQWWRQQIAAAMAGEPVDHPVLRELAALLRDHPAAAERLRATVDARDALLLAAEPSDADGIESFAARTSGGLQATLSEIATGPSAAASKGAAAIGTAYGILRRARAGASDAGIRTLPLAQPSGEPRHAAVFGADALNGILERVRACLERAEEDPPRDLPTRLLHRLVRRQAALVERRGGIGREVAGSDPWLALRLWVWARLMR